MSELERQPGGKKRGDMPRLSLRYPCDAASVQLTLPRRGFFGRERSVDVQAEMLDVSIGGALVALPDDAPVRSGIRLDLTLDGEHTTAGIRHVGPVIDGRCRCGIAFRTPSPAFEAVVHETIESLVTDPKRKEAWRMNG